MTISDRDKVDIVQVRRRERLVNLMIADHLPWGGGEDDEKEHMYLLQEKLNSYLSYIEGGQLLGDYPHARGFEICIHVHGKFDRSKNAVSFYERCGDILRRAGYDLSFISIEE